VNETNDTVEGNETNESDDGNVTVQPADEEDAEQDDYEIGAVIGASEYLTEGQHENVTITLNETLSENQTLVAMPHQDTNDNETYDFTATNGSEDGPYTYENGSPVTDDAFVTVEDEAEDNVTENETEAAAEAEANATVRFDNQTTSGEIVGVASVNLSEGGFVTIHNESLLEGNVTGSVVGVSEYLEPGEHSDVAIRLFNVSGATFENDSLEEDQTLIAMPHQDTNDNETYDFVATNGSEDGPYVNETGAPVIDDAFVTVQTFGDVTDENATAENATAGDNATDGDGTDYDETLGAIALHD
jgi:hypothetical protein